LNKNERRYKLTFFVLLEVHNENKTQLNETKINKSMHQINDNQCMISAKTIKVLNINEMT